MPRTYKIPCREFLDAKPFRINGDPCKLIRLTQGQFAIVDADLYPFLSMFNWFAIWAPRINSFYACRAESIGSQKTRMIRMHREVMRLSGVSARVIDHIDPWQTLNNTRRNLRAASAADNCHNARISRINRSGYKGVSFHKETGKYVAQIGINGKRIYLGLRNTAAEAFQDLYVPAALSAFGEFANLAKGEVPDENR